MRIAARKGCAASMFTDASGHGVVSTGVEVRDAITVGQRQSGEQGSQRKILLAEDSPVYRHLISGHLKEWGFDLQIAKDGAAAWKLLQAPDAPRLALLDWVLPKIEGVELCRRIRNAQALSDYTYIVLLTGKDAKNDLLEGMRAGADDYLAKPFHPPELKARLLAGKRILDLQGELVSARESLRVAATYDFLTGLLNRGEIVAWLDRELVRAKRETSPVGVILADIDHFKNVNDSHGHSAGDAVLKEVARRLKSDLRVYDGAGRYGGEEFVLILPGCDRATTVRRAEEIRRLVSSTGVMSPKGIERVTVSMGVTCAAGDRNTNVEALLNEADLALYRAKENGRNRVEAY
jgi:two-component system, cell cycle response regulator